MRCGSGEAAELSPRETSGAHHHASVVLALAAITFLAAFLRFHLLTKRSFWMDEGVSIAIARLDWQNFLRLLWRREANMSFYYLLLRGWLHLGHSEFFIRALSVISGIGTVPALYLFANRLFGQFVALASALLLALNAYHVRYSQEARSYSLAVFLVTLSSFYFVRVIENPTARDIRTHAISSVLAVYSHFFAALVLIAQWMSLRLFRSQPVLRAALPHFRRIIYFVAPIFLFIVTTGAGPISWVPKTTLQSVYGLLFWLSGMVEHRFLVLYVLFLVIIAVVTINLRRQYANSSSSPAWRYGYVLCWFFVPIIITLLFSFVRPAFLPRYLLVCQPALCLCLALAMPQLRIRMLSLAALALFSWFSLQGLKQYYNGVTDSGRENWRAATSDLLAQAQAGDAVLFHNGQGRMPFEYYEQDSPATLPRPIVIFPNREGHLTFRDFMGKPDIQLLTELPKHYRRVWVVLSHVQDRAGIDPTARLIRTVLGNEYPRSKESSFEGIDIVRYAKDAE